MMHACLLAITPEAALCTEGVACILSHQDHVARYDSTELTRRLCILVNNVCSASVCHNVLISINMQLLMLVSCTTGMTPCAVLNAINAALLSEQW